MVGRIKLLKEKPEGIKANRGEGNDRGFSLVELVVAIGILLVIGVAVSYGYPGYVDWRNSSEVKLATQTAYESAINVIDNPWEEMTIDEVMSYVEGEYKNVELAYTGSTAADLCVTGGLKGDAENKHVMNRGACDGAPSPNPDPSDGETTEPPVEIGTGGTMSFQCDATTTARLPFYGIEPSATIAMNGDDGSTLSVSHVEGRTESVTMNSGVTYNVTVDGTFTALNAIDLATYEMNFHSCILSVSDWAEGLEMVNFYLAEKLVSVPDFLPSTVTFMPFIFASTNYNGSEVTTWDTSNVNTMYGAFAMNPVFNQDISGWDVSNVTELQQMFMDAPSFNQDLSNWDVSNATMMAYMFTNSGFNNGSARGASDNPLDWDVSSMEVANSMFSNSPFNQPINQWDISSLTSSSDMFKDATYFNQPLNSWDTSNLKNFSGMFDNASSFSQDLSMWNVSSHTTHTNFDRSSGLTPEQLPNF